MYWTRSKGNQISEATQADLTDRFLNLIDKTPLADLLVACKTTKDLYGIIKLRPDIKKIERAAGAIVYKPTYDDIVLAAGRVSNRLRRASAE